MKTCCFSSSLAWKVRLQIHSWSWKEWWAKISHHGDPQKWKHHYLTTGETPCSDEVQVLSLRVHEQLLNGPWVNWLCAVKYSLRLKLHTILPCDSQQPQHLSTCWRCDPWALSCEHSIITWVLSTHGQDHTHLWNLLPFDLIYTLVKFCYCILHSCVCPLTDWLTDRHKNTQKNTQNHFCLSSIKKMCMQLI